MKIIIHLLTDYPSLCDDVVGPECSAAIVVRESLHLLQPKQTLGVFAAASSPSVDRFH